jgi:hypothetical protein
MSTEQKPGDPADRAVDAKADGAFGGAVSHRAGYGGIEFEGQTYTKLQWVERTARIGGTLAAGEGRMLLAEIDRQRAILAALREPSKWVVDAMMNWLVWTDRPFVKNAIRGAVTAAELEVGA